MKQYVLDEPYGAVPEDESAAAPAASSWLRTLLLLLVLEPVAFGLFVFFSGGPGEGRVATNDGYAYLASSALPPRTAPAQPVTDAVPVPESRISQQHGAFVIDLHTAPPGQALALLTGATKAHVTGGDIFNGSPLQLTLASAVSSPQDAWRAVFGNIANYAITCTGSACDVRFVSLTRAAVPAFVSGAVQSPPQSVAAMPAAAPPDKPAIYQGATAAAPPAQSGDPASSEN